MSRILPPRVDAAGGSGYSDIMERGVEKTYVRRPRLRGGFFLTLLWLAPVMALAAAGGFLMARNFFAPKYLKPTEVRSNRPRPTRIIPPEEAAETLHSEPSDVWSAPLPEAPRHERRHTRRVSETAPSPPPTDSGSPTTSPAPASDAPADGAVSDGDATPVPPAPVSAPTHPTTPGDQPLSPD